MVEKQLQVIIADDHPLIRVGIRKMLESSPDIKVVAEATHGQEAIDLVMNLSPNLLILDLNMPVLDGFQVLDILHDQCPNLLILIVSALDDPGIIEEVLAHGAWGFYPKEKAPTQLLSAVRKASKHLARSPFTPSTKAG